MQNHLVKHRVFIKHRGNGKNDRACTHETILKMEQAQWLPDRWCFTSVDPVLYKISVAKVMWTCGEDIICMS